MIPDPLHKLICLDRIEREIKRRISNLRLMLSDPLRAIWFIEPPSSPDLSHLSAEELMAERARLKEEVGGYPQT